jgi:hypothetical protein
MLLFSLSYEASPIFIAQKNPRNFPNIFWVMPHPPMQRFSHGHLENFSQGKCFYFWSERAHCEATIFFLDPF